MPPKPKINVQSFPRPPLLEKTNRHLQVKYQGHIIAEAKSGEAFWVLETYHAPTYYFPPSSIKLPLKKSSARSTYCEWKGMATYHDIDLPSSSANSPPQTAKARIWSYESPTSPFKDLKGYLSFYAGSPWECLVDGEEVVPQPGDFYGGWTTSELEGIIKGDAKTRWM